MKNKLDIRFEPIEKINPYYLRGHFDADTLVDYVVAMRDQNSKRNVLVICRGSGGMVFMSEDEGPRPDPPGSREGFLSSQWQVFTSREIREQKLEKYAPTKSEVIALLWDDSTRLIYWDGRQFRWSKLINLLE